VKFVYIEEKAFTSIGRIKEMLSKLFSLFLLFL